MNLQQLLDDYGKAYDAITDRQTFALTRTFTDGWEQIEAEYRALNDRIKQAEENGEAISPSWAFRQERYKTLMAQISAQNAALMDVARQQIDAGVESAANLGAQHAEGLTTAISPSVRGTFSSLPTDAVKAIAGAVQDAESPVHQLLNSIAGADVGFYLSRQIANGIVTGRNPNVTARMMRQEYAGLSLARATRIARTETMRAYREGAHQSYLRNSDVVGEWMWLAARQSRTCACCWAMSGTRHPLTERLDGHPNCRCRAIPVPLSAQQLGLPDGIDVTPGILTEEQSGEKLFADLPDDVKLAVLGPGKFKAYKEGQIALSDLVSRKQSEVWGPMRTEASLAQAFENSKARKAGEATPATTPAPAGKQPLTPEKQITNAISNAKAAINKVRRGSTGQDIINGTFSLSNLPVDRAESALSYGPDREFVPTKNGKAAERAVTRAGKLLVDEACRLADVDPKEFQDSVTTMIRHRDKAYALEAKKLKNPGSVTEDEYREAFELLNQANRRAIELRNAVIPKVQSLLPKYTQMGGTIETINPRSPVTKALQEVSHLLPTRWIKAAQEKTLRVYSDPTRAHFTTETVRSAAGRRGQGVIKVNPAHTSIVLHEAMHYMEDGQFKRRGKEDVPGQLASLQRLFVLRRANGEDLQPLQKLKPGDGYGSDEYAYADRFITPYIGKTYSDGHHEVLSMGMESVYGSRLTDADHLSFTIGCILTA